MKILLEICKYILAFVVIILFLYILGNILQGILEFMSHILDIFGPILLFIMLIMCGLAIIFSILENIKKFRLRKYEKLTEQIYIAKSKNYEKIIFYKIEDLYYINIQDNFLSEINENDIIFINDNILEIKINIKNLYEKAILKSLKKVEYIDIEINSESPIPRFIISKYEKSFGED